MGSRALSLTFVLALGAAVPAVAQEGRGDEYSGAPAAPGEPSKVFGVQNNLLQISASRFSTRLSTVAYQPDGFGYVYSTSSPSITTFWTDVELPTGVVVDRIGLFFFDADATNSITARLQRYTGTTTPGTATIGSVTSPAGTPMAGYATAAITVPEVVNNNAAGGGSHYAVLIDIPNASINLRFKAVELRWHRQVSPAPGVATFPNDVPTSHPFFRFVEALADAGVTAGCGAGAYCPNNPVTRGEMAVFLATALGLHFPN